MTVEEKKVIEYWEEKLKEYKKEIEQRQNDEFKGYGTAEDIAKLKYCNLHTILNLIQTQQEEIFKLQAKVDRLKVARENWKKTYKQAEKEEEKYKYLYQKALDNTIKADRDNLKKDKIIDEMANYIWTYDCCEYEIGKEGKCEGYYKNDDCREKCIKEYFINKVEKENKDDN